MKKKYTEDFKRQAVELADSLHNGVAAAKQLGISDSLIYSWRIKFKESEPKSNKTALQTSERNIVEPTRLVSRHN